MRKFWLVCWNEYRRHVFRLRFLMVLLSLPFFVLLSGAVGALAVAGEYDPRPLGVVDPAGWFNPNLPLPQQDSQFPPVKVILFPDENAGVEAVKQEKVQAVYIFSADYLENGKLNLVAEKPLRGMVRDQFRELLQANLLAEQPPEISTRILEGPDITVQTPLTGRQTGSNDWVKLLLPLLSGVLFVIVINTSGGYLLQAVVEEKENRTMEIIVTSLSPLQLMAGKVIGSLSIGLTQLLVWLLFPLLAYLVLRDRFPFLQELSLEPRLVGLMVASLLAAFIMVAGLMAAIGAMATESREAQQFAGIFTLPIVAPYWFIAPIMTSPNSPLARGLSYFPLTSPVTLPLRAAFTDLPAWEITLSLGLLVIAAAASLWLSARVFRMGMLRYGKALSWKEIFQRGN